MPVFSARHTTVFAMRVPEADSLAGLKEAAQWSGGTADYFTTFDGAGEETTTAVVVLDRPGGPPSVAWPGQWMVKGLRQDEVLVLSDALFSTLYVAE